MADNTLERLLKTLRDRDIAFDRTAIESAFRDPDSQTAIQGWVEEYLTDDTLLTKEEAALYASLKKTGEFDKISASHDLGVIPGLGELDVQVAIDELKRSTAAIEKQTETLKLQQNAMSMLVKSNAHVDKARAQSNSNQTRRWEVENGQITAAIEEISENLSYQTLELQQQVKASEANVKQTVDGILKSDDKLLSSLQKLSSSLEPSQSADDVLVEKIRELCARLIKHTVEGVRTKLDRIYLEALGKPKTSSSGDSEPTETEDLQEELESLYAEILPVAQMSVEQQYLEPALQEIKARSGQGQQRTEEAVVYIYKCLVFLVNKIGLFLERAEEHRSHQNSVRLVIDTANKELKVPEPVSQTNAVKPVQRPRKVSSAQSPGRLRGNRRRSSTNFDEEVEPEQQLLRSLGISLPADADSDEARVTILERALHDRMSKLETHSTSLQATTESSISSYLLDAQITMQILRDSLLAESPFGTVRLLDDDTESAVNALEFEVEKLHETLGQVDLRKLQARNVHREELVERWSR